MTTAVVLAVYAVVGATLGAVLLRRASWPQRAPRLGIATWQALSASTLAAMVLAGAALSVRLPSLSTDIAGLFRACLMNLRAGYATPAGSLATTIGLAVALSVGGRALWCLVLALAGTRSQQRRQLRVLAVLAHRDTALGALVIDHSSPAVFCLAGRGRPIVLTTAALAALAPVELAAVLAHERAHLRGRHHLLVTATRGLARAFPGVPVFRDANEQVACLVEMVADDAACRGSRPEVVASAVLALADGTAPTTALAAGKSSVEVRLLRLQSPLSPLGPSRRFVLAGLVSVLIFAPLMLAAVPAIAAADVDHCPLGDSALTLTW